MGKEELWKRYSEVYRLVLPKISFFRELHKEVIELCRPHNTILDAGCGPGLYFEALLEQGKEVYGIDSSDDMIAISMNILANSLKAKENKLSESYVKSCLRVGDIAKLPYLDNSFDAVININVLYAVENPLVALREMFRTTRPGGALIIAGPKPRAIFDGQKLKTQMENDLKEYESDPLFREKKEIVLKINERILSERIVTECDLEKIMAMVIEAGYRVIQYNRNDTYCGQGWLLKAVK